MKCRPSSPQAKPPTSPITPSGWRRCWPRKRPVALLGGEGARLTDEQIDRIAGLIEKARKEGGK